MNPVTEKQTCTKCNKEKSLSEYHRRGAGHKRICKECIKLKYRADCENRNLSGVEKAQARKIDNADFLAMQERINKLLPRIKAAIYRFISDPENFEDVLQIAIKSILEKCSSEDKDSYIVTCARFAAMNQMQKTNLHSYYHPPLSDGEESPEIPVQVSRSAEDELIQREEMGELKKIIDSLPPKNRKIISLLTLGYKQNEIARIVKTTPANVNDHIQKFRRRLILSGIASPVVTVGVI